MQGENKVGRGSFAPTLVYTPTKLQIRESVKLTPLVWYDAPYMVCNTPYMLCAVT